LFSVVKFKVYVRTTAPPEAAASSFIHCSSSASVAQVDYMAQLVRPAAVHDGLITS